MTEEFIEQKKDLGGIYMSIAIGVLGGLGLFLYGMQMMGNGLQKAAGKKLERPRK